VSALELFYGGDDNAGLENAGLELNGPRSTRTTK